MHRVARQREQVDRLPGQRPLLVQPGQQQQVLDEQAHPGRFLFHPLHEPVQVAGGEPVTRRGRLIAVPARLHPAALAVVLGETADRGQRGSQLVAGVRDEPAHSLLGPVRRRLGFLARVEGRLDLAQHDVQRPPEAADLGAGVALRHPPVEVAVGDGLRGLLDLVQRSQVGPHRRHAHQRQDEHDDAAHDHVEVGDAADRGVDIAQIRADDERPRHLLRTARAGDGLIAIVSGDHAPGVAAGLRRHGHQGRADPRPARARGQGRERLPRLPGTADAGHTAIGPGELVPRQLDSREQILLAYNPVEVSGRLADQVVRVEARLLNWHPSARYRSAWSGTSAGHRRWRRRSRRAR